MKIKMIFSVILCLLITGTAYAAPQGFSADIKYDYGSRQIEISGKFENSEEKDDKIVTVQILKSGSFETLSASSDLNSLIMYLDQQKTIDGKYKFVVEYGGTVDTGEYPARLVTTGISKPYDFTVSIVDKDEYKGAIDLINEKARANDFDGFCDALEESLDTLSFKFDLTDDFDFSSMSNYYDYVCKNPLSYDKSDENIIVFKTYAVISELNQNNLEDITLYIGILNISSDVKESYTDFASSETVKKHITKNLSGKKIKNIEELENVFKEALILSAARYGDGYGDLKNMVEKYGDAMEISAVSDKDVYRELLGKEYTKTSFVKAYKNASGSDSNSEKRHSTSSGGGLGGVQYTVDNEKTTSGEVKNTAIAVKFNDIDGVAWASEAIYYLSDNGIVNGNGNGLFKPNDVVTREQFVKMLVEAMGCGSKAYEKNNFADADDNAWYTKYVNIAYENGICKGIGGGMFGIGGYLTRQDMAVFLHNVLKSKKEVGESSELYFGDRAQIADYAYEAVADLYSLGIVNGTSEDAFSPYGQATRAEAATVIYRVLPYIR